jgi:hypothetical protein
MTEQKVIESGTLRRYSVTMAFQFLGNHIIFCPLVSFNIVFSSLFQRFPCEICRFIHLHILMVHYLIDFLDNGKSYDFWPFSRKGLISQLLQTKLNEKNKIHLSKMDITQKTIHMKQKKVHLWF